MESKITFHEFVDAVAAESGATKQLTHDFLVELANVIDEGLERDQRVKIADLGIFELRHIPATTGIHPQTGEVIEIADHHRAAFRPGKKLESAVNERFRYLEAEFTDEPSKSKAAPVTQIEADPSPKTIVKPTEPPKTDDGGGVNRIAAIAAILAIALIGWWLISGDAETDSAQVDAVAAPLEDVPTTPAEPVEQLPVPVEVIREEPEPVNIVQPAQAEQYSIVKQYTTRRGDNLWNLAEGEYTIGLYWPNIYRVNVELLPHPDVLGTGLEIGIPGLQGSPLRLTKQDSLDISNGYYEAFLAYRREGNPYARFYLWMSERFK